MVSCDRSSCAEPAVVALSFHPGERVVWLSDLAADHHQLLSLCGVHADRVTVPRGWDRRDERTGAPRLWTHTTPVQSEEDEGAAADGSPGSSSSIARLDHRRARRAAAVERLRLFDDEEPVARAPEQQQLAGFEGDGDGDTSEDLVVQRAVPESVSAVGGARSTLIPGTAEQPSDDDAAPSAKPNADSTPLLARAFRASS